MFTAWLVGDKELIERVTAMPDKIRSRVATAVAKLARDLQRHVMQDKLSGQVLHRRTGTLRSSINVKGPEETTTGVTASVGTNVVYAGIHEFGGVIDMPPRTTTINRRFDESRLRASGRFVKAGTPGAIATTHAVGGYQIHMPERSFLRSALHDMEQRIKDGLTAAVGEGLNEK